MKISRSVILLIALLFPVTILAQAPSKSVKKWLAEEDERAKLSFPPHLIEKFKPNTLGSEFQEYFKKQAENDCGIKRTDTIERNYIPKDIIESYTESKLKTTSVQLVNASSNNVLFFSLKPEDINSLQDGTFDEYKYVEGKRVIGLRDNFVDYGSSYLNPILGFPSYYFQKSCGCYFTGNLNSGIKIPIGELEHSIDAETKKNSMITTITGKFFSPLFLILSQSSKKSVYAHLLIWEAYAEDDKNTLDKSNLLINIGKYISEFDATLIHYSNDRYSNINMGGRIGMGITAGIFSLDGTIKSGMENKQSFSMVDFSTLIHRSNDGRLKYSLVRLPSVEQISSKLQNSLSYNPQPSIQGNATYLVPFTFSRTMAGVPSTLCSNNSWVVENWDSKLWVRKPSVSSISELNNNKDLPDCICTIQGDLRKIAIDSALITTRGIMVNITLSNTQIVNNQKIQLTITEPFVRVSRGPTLSNIDENVINAAAKLSEVSGKKNMEYSTILIVDDSELEVKSPLEILELGLEYLNKNDATDNKLNITYNQSTGKRIEIIIKTEQVLSSFNKTAEISVPIKIKLRIKLKDGIHETILVSNTINVRVPIFSEPKLE